MVGKARLRAECDAWRKAYHSLMVRLDQLQDTLEDALSDEVDNSEEVRILREEIDILEGRLYRVVQSRSKIGGLLAKITAERDEWKATAEGHAERIKALLDDPTLPGLTATGETDDDLLDLVRAGRWNPAVDLARKLGILDPVPAETGEPVAPESRPLKVGDEVKTPLGARRKIVDISGPTGQILYFAGGGCAPVDCCERIEGDDQ